MAGELGTGLPGIRPVHAASVQVREMGRLPPKEGRLANSRQVDRKVGASALYLVPSSTCAQLPKGP